MKTNKGFSWQRRVSLPPSAVEVTDNRPLAAFSDTELLRYGMVLKRKNALEGEQVGERPDASFALWKELRKEWGKRFPDLPLSATFDDCLKTIPRSGQSGGRKPVKLLTSGRTAGA
jgi:hypothetical protein